jgi:hypothetical protein
MSGAVGQGVGDLMVKSAKESLEEGKCLLKREVQQSREETAAAVFAWHVLPDKE